MRLRSFALALLSLIILALSTGCDDDECRERVDPLEREEEQREQITELLDDADVPEPTSARILGVYKAMEPLRQKTRAAQEREMTKLLHELLQPEPSAERSRGQISALSRHVTAYAHGAADRLLQVHALLDHEQRADIADEVEDSGGRFPSDFMIDRGVDYVLFKIDASTPQKVRIIEIKDAMMRRFKALRAKQGRERRFLLGQWRDPSPDREAVHASIDRASAQLTGFGHRAIDAYLRMISLLRPQQRVWLDGRVESMRTCPADKGR